MRQDSISVAFFDVLKACRPGKHKLAAAAEACEEVRFYETCQYPDISIQIVSVYPKFLPGTEAPRDCHGFIVIAVVLDDSVIADYVFAQQLNKFRERTGSMRTKSVDEDYPVPPDSNTLHFIQDDRENHLVRHRSGSIAERHCHRVRRLHHIS